MFSSATVGDEGSVVLAGTTTGAWGKSRGSSDGVTSVKLDANGIELWRWQVIRPWHIDYGLNVFPANRRLVWEYAPCMSRETCVRMDMVLVYLMKIVFTTRYEYVAGRCQRIP